MFHRPGTGVRFVSKNYGTEDIGIRYSAGQIDGGGLNVLAEGTRREMLKLERDLHRYLPIGPEEKDNRWINIQTRSGLRHPDDYHLNK